MDKSQRYREFLVQPLWQGIAVLSMMLFFVSLEWLLKKMGIAADKANSPWMLTTSLILFYTIFNSILSIKAEVLIKYWGRSIMTFIALLVAGGFLAYLVSGLTIDEAGSFRWLYVVLTMGYLIFLAIVQSMKRIVDVAIKQDKRLRNEE